MKRRCIVKELYSKLTPYIQLAGWLVLFGSISLGAQYYIGAVDAVAATQSEQAKLIISIKEDIAEIKGAVSVIKEYTKPKR